VLRAILSFIFSIASFVLRVISWVLPVYFIAKLVLPQNKYVMLAGKYMEWLMAPIRDILGRLFPRLAARGLDLSPIALWILVLLAQWCLQLLKAIFL